MNSLYASRNKIMVSGCSWTQESQLDHKRDFRPQWPKLLSEKLNKEYNNYGRSGAGNQHIYNQVVDNYDGEDLICVLWSGWDRLDFPKGHSNDVHSMSETNHDPKEVWDALYKVNFINPIANIKKGLKFIHAFQNFCEINNIKYIHALAFEGEQLFTAERSRILNKFINDRIHDYIDKDHFIGWPCFKELNGYTMSNYLNKLAVNIRKDMGVGKSMSIFRISAKDYHPNKKGHTIIADLFYDRYVELYGEP